ncbi:hypothetical protein P7C70_g7519, partial [Phenoliferia sp. Uapishka_3]
MYSQIKVLVPPLLPKLTETLIQRFWSKEGYSIHSDVLPFLDSLSSLGVTGGAAVVSGSDPDVIRVLRDLGVLAEAGSREGVPRVREEEVWTSWEFGCEKRTDAFWENVLKMMNGNLGEKERRYEANEVLVVGDELQADYETPRRVGLRSLLLRRRLHAGEHARASHGDEEGGESDLDVVEDLAQVGEWTHYLSNLSPALTGAFSPIRLPVEPNQFKRLFQATRGRLSELEPESELLALVFMLYESQRTRNPSIIGSAPPAPDLRRLRSKKAGFSEGDHSTVGLRRYETSIALQNRLLELIERVWAQAMNGDSEMFPVIQFAALMHKGKGEKPAWMLRILGSCIGAELERQREMGKSLGELKAFSRLILVGAASLNFPAPLAHKHIWSLWNSPTEQIAFPVLSSADISYLFDTADDPTRRSPLPVPRTSSLQLAWASILDITITTRFGTSLNISDSIFCCWKQAEDALRYARVEAVVADLRLATTTSSWMLDFLMQMMYLEELALRSISACHHLLLSLPGWKKADAMRQVSSGKLEACVEIIARKVQLLLSLDIGEEDLYRLCSTLAEEIEVLLQHIAIDCVVDLVRRLPAGPRSGLLLALSVGGYRDPRCSRTYLAFVRRLPMNIIDCNSLHAAKGNKDGELEYFASWVGFDRDEDCWISEESASYVLYALFRRVPPSFPPAHLPPIRHGSTAPERVNEYWATLPASKQHERFAPRSKEAIAAKAKGARKSNGGATSSATKPKSSTGSAKGSAKRSHPVEVEDDASTDGEGEDVNSKSSKTKKAANGTTPKSATKEKTPKAEPQPKRKKESKPAELSPELGDVEEDAEGEVDGRRNLKHEEDFKDVSDWEPLVSHIDTVERANNGNGDLMLFVVWSEDDTYSWVSSKLVRAKCPQKVIDFYEPGPDEDSGEEREEGAPGQAVGSDCSEDEDEDASDIAKGDGEYILGGHAVTTHDESVSFALSELGLEPLRLESRSFLFSLVWL